MKIDKKKIKKLIVILRYIFFHPKKFYHALPSFGKKWARRGATFALIFIAAISLSFLFFKKPTSAAWWNDLWQYRKAIAVTNSSGANLTDFQVKILDNKDLSADITAGKIQADLDDLRFTDANGNIFPYWIEDSTGSSVDVWIKVPMVHTTGTTVYMYYGNPSVTGLADGKKVFEYFDDFNDNSLDAAMWTEADSPAEIAETGGKLVFTGGAGGSWDQAVYLNTAITRDNMAMQFDYQWTSSNASYDAFMFGWKDDGAGMSYVNLVYGYYNMSQDTCTTCSTYIYEDGGGGSAGSGNWVQNTNYKVRLRMRNSGGAYYDQSADGGANWTTSYTSTYSTESNLHPAWTLHSGTHNVDNFFVRKDATTAPLAGTPAAEEKSAGPTAYWSFDEGYGTTAYDYTSSGKNGTLTGMSATPLPTSGWQTDDKCISGKCLAFDGTNDYVGTGTTSLNMGTSDFSISAWVKSKSTASGNNNGIVYKRGTGYSYSEGYRLNMPNGQFNFHIADGTNYNSLTIGNSGQYNDGKWHHVTAVATRGSEMRIYVDGVSRGSVAETNVGNINSNVDLEIGALLGGYHFFNGSIDEPKIYNYARTAAQVKSDYNSGLAGMGKAKEGVGLGVGDRSDKWMTDSLLGYWKMDETSGNCVDSSGNGITGTANGTTVVPGKFGSGRQFNGTSDNVGISYTNPVTATSVVAWFKRTGTPNGDYHIITGGQDVEISISQSGGGYIRTGVTTSTMGRQVFNSGTGLVDGNWHQVALTYDGSSLNSYIDGVQTSSNSVSGNLSGTVQEIGRYLSNSYVANGIIDEVRIYGRGLSPSEIQQLYNWAPGPVGYWKMDEGNWNGTTGEVADSSVYGNSGTRGGNATTSSGKYGKAGIFDGAGDYVLIPATSILDVQDFTISSWNYSDDYDQNMFMFEKTTNGSVNTQYSLFYNNGGSNHQIYFRTYGLSTTDLYVTDSANGPVKGRWNHIVATYNSATGTKKIYCNGIEIASQTDLTGAITTNPAGTSWIGTYGGGSGYPFNGKIDEMKIYNYTRTQKQIIEDMNAGHPAGGSPVGSQVGYWKFDEGYGGTAYNLGIGGSASNGNLGTGLSAPSWTNNGKFGKALNFDGSDDYVDIPQPMKFSKNSYTASFWVYVSSSNSANRSVLSEGAWGAGGRGWGIDFYSSDQWWGGKTGYINFSYQFVGSGTVGIVKCNYSGYENSWVHVAGVKDYSTQTMALYLNGRLCESNYYSDMQSTETDDYQTSLKVGRSSWTAAGFLDGKVDEVKIYPSALTADEIKLDMNQGKSLIMGSAGTTASGEASFSADRAYCPPGDTTANCGPVAEWKFDEGSGTTANDTSGNKYNASLENTPSWSTGKIGNSIIFNGNNQRGIGGTGISPSNISIEAWVYRTSSSTNQGIVRKPNAYAISLYNDTVQIAPGNNWTFYNTSQTILLNTWTHLVFTYDGTTLKLYKNGQYVWNATLSGSLPSNNSSVYLGYDDNGWWWGGKLDQIQIYNYARTPSQVAYDYNRGKPVGWWKMDEGEGTSVYDWSGNGNTGTMTSMDPPNDWVAGKYNKALDFDGSDDYVDAGTFSVTNSISITYWLKTSGTGDAYYVGRGNINDGTGDAFIGWGYGDELMIRLLGLSTYQVRYDNANYLRDGNWHFIAGTYNGSVLAIYGDGKLLNSVSSTGSITMHPTYGWRINGYPSSGTPTFDAGQIDDVRIYNYGLTAEQVKQAMNDGAVRYGP